LYQQYGPQLAAAGSQIQNQSNQALAAGTANLTGQGGAGQQLVSNAVDLQHQVDPQYYSTLSAAAPQVANLLSQAGQFANGGLSPTEIDSIQKGLARENQQASAFLPASQSGINGFNVATSQNGQAQANPANNLFTGVNTNNMGGGSQFASNISSGLSNDYSNQQMQGQQLYSQKKDWMDMWGQIAGNVNSSASAIGSIGGMALG